MPTAAPSRFLVTSIVRRAGQQQASGFIRVVERSSSRVLMKAPVPESRYRAQDPNPRGGLRGARGLSVWQDRLVIANSELLLVFDPQWRLVDEITHPWMGGVHDILAEEGGIWVTCTTADLLVRFGWDGEVLESWEWRADAGLREALGFTRLPPVDRSLDFRDPESMRDGVRDTVHLNGVTRGTHGLLLSFGRVPSRSQYRRQQLNSLVGGAAKRLGLRRRSNAPEADGDDAPLPPTVPVDQLQGSTAALVRLRPDGTAEVLYREDDRAVPNHNVLEAGPLVVFNNSNTNEVVGLDRQSRSPRHRVPIPGAPAFARGLAWLGHTQFLVGSQGPAAVYEVDLVEEVILKTHDLAGEPNETVYAIALLPDTFGTPPQRLV